MIQKTADNNTTTTHIKHLDEKESVDELARLLSGSEITQTVIKTAEEMKDMAKRTKSH